MLNSNKDKIRSIKEKSKKLLEQLDQLNSRYVFTYEDRAMLRPLFFFYRLPKYLQKLSHSGKSLQTKRKILDDLHKRLDKASEIIIMIQLKH